MLSGSLVSRGILSGLVAAIVAASAPNAYAGGKFKTVSRPKPPVIEVPELVPLPIPIPLDGSDDRSSPKRIRSNTSETLLFESLGSEAISVDCVEAKACYETANLKFNGGEFKESASFFLRTYDLAFGMESRLELLRNAAIAFEHAGDPSNALRFYREYVKRKTKKGDRKGIIQITSRYDALLLYAKGIDSLEKKDYNSALESLTATESLLRSDNPPVSLCGDIARAYEAAEQKDPALARYRSCLNQVVRLGKYFVVKDKLETKVLELSLPKAESESLVPSYSLAEIQLKPTSEEIPRIDPLPPREPSFLSQHTWSMIAGGVGVAAFSAGAGLNYLGNSKFEELVNGCGQTQAGCSQRDVDSLKTYFTGRNVSYVAGGILAAAGVALFIAESLYNPKPMNESKKPKGDERAGLYVSPNGAFTLRY